MRIGFVRIGVVDHRERRRTVGFGRRGDWGWFRG